MLTIWCNAQVSDSINEKTTSYVDNRIWGDTIRTIKLLIEGLQCENIYLIEEDKQTLRDGQHTERQPRKETVIACIVFFFLDER